MQDKNQIYGRSGVRGIFFLAFILAIFFSYEMGNRHFADPDEGRYVEIPREMVVTGDFVTPKLNGLKYFEKPPLFYWMQAGAIKAFGINETSMRLWTVIFAILGCLGVFLAGLKCRSDAVGLISSGILATNILYYAHSRLIILDLVNSVLMSGALWCFFLAFVRSPRPSEKSVKKLIVAAAAFSALACLTKGLIGLVLPGAIVFAWIALTKNWPKINEILYLPAVLIFFAIFLPWHILVAQRNEGFLRFYFIVEHFLRYSSTIHNRYKPFWFFLPVLLVGLLPWTGFALVAIKNSIKKALAKNSEDIFLNCWIFVTLGFFSFSNSKLIPYILPLLPPVALATGITLVESIDSKNKDFKIGVWSSAILFLIAFVAYLFAKSEIADVLRDPNAILVINIFAGLMILAAFVLISSLFFKISGTAVVLTYLFIAANMMQLINKASVLYQETKKPTTKWSAESINLNRREGDLVFCYKRYYQDFPVYLNSTVGIVDFVGELEHGASLDKDNDKLIKEDAFWKLWNAADKRIFLLLAREHYIEVFNTRNPIHKILDSNKYFVTIINK